MGGKKLLDIFPQLFYITPIMYMKVRSESEIQQLYDTITQHAKHCLGLKHSQVAELQA